MEDRSTVLLTNAEGLIAKLVQLAAQQKTNIHTMMVPYWRGPALVAVRIFDTEGRIEFLVAGDTSEQQALEAAQNTIKALGIYAWLPAGTWKFMTYDAEEYADAARKTVKDVASFSIDLSSIIIVIGILWFLK